MKVGVVRDDRYLGHDPGPYHPESPQRLRAIHGALDRACLPVLQVIEPREAQVEELCWNHSQRYVEEVLATAGRGPVQLDPDTAAGPGSALAARLAVGGLFQAVEAVAKGEVGSAFALVRPPGHHAEQDRAMGFCLFNNVALAAHYARRRLGLRRVLIVDWDLHHGNGTQHAFWSQGEVLYFSTHQYPYYPGTGAVEEVGEGAGRGATVNVPLAPGAGDADFLHIYWELLAPVVRSFGPDLILVSAGFDIAAGDPLGGMAVSPQGFGALAAVVRSLAQELCGGRLVLTLEGGYSLNALAQGVVEVTRALASEDPPPRHHARPTPAVAAVVERVKETLSPFYPHSWR